MPPVFSFRGCQAKLDRARSHRDTLNRIIEQHFSIPSNQPTLSAILDSSDGCHVFRIASLPSVSELQEAIAIFVGDAIHNLRSALDHLAFQLALISTNGLIKRPWKVQFPIANTHQRYAKEEKQCLGELRPEYQKRIESYQPYHGIAGRPDTYSGAYIHQLSLLQELSNTDKHRLLNTVLIISGGAKFTLPPGIGTLPMAMPTSAEEALSLSPFRNAGNTLTIGAEVLRERLVGSVIPSEISDVGSVIPHIGLENKRSLIPTLARLEQFVEVILNDFAKEAAS